jgi:hypothetical protein
MLIRVNTMLDKGQPPAPLRCPLLCRVVPQLFECLPQDDLERRINGGLRPPAFAKGTEQDY